MIQITSYGGAISFVYIDNITIKMHLFVRMLQKQQFHFLCIVRNISFDLIKRYVPMVDSFVEIDHGIFSFSPFR